MLKRMPWTTAAAAGLACLRPSRSVSSCRCLLFFLPPHTTQIAQVSPRRRLGTSPRHHSRVVFTPTDQPRLDEVLQKILHTIILPARLPEKQRRLVFNVNRRQELLQNPVVVEVDGYEYNFPTIDALGGDVPSTPKIIVEALGLMRTRRDWENLGILLRGLREAGRELLPGVTAKMVRRAGQDGQVWCVIDCARRSEETGLLLNTPEVAAHALAWAGMHAVRAGWEEKASRQAARWAEMVEELMQDKAHANPSRPLHRDPLLQALCLFPAAGVALKHDGGRDADGLLARRAKLVTALWPVGENADADGTNKMRVRYLSNMYSEKAYAEANKGFHFLTRHTALLTMGSLVVAGMRMASRVLEAGGEKALAAGLDVIQRAVHEDVRRFAEMEGDKPASGKSVYRETVLALENEGETTAAAGEAAPKETLAEDESEEKGREEQDESEERGLEEQAPEEKEQ